MKSKVTAIIFILSVLIATFCACNKNNVPVINDTINYDVTEHNIETTQHETTRYETTESNNIEEIPNADYNSIYSATLNKFMSLFSTASDDGFNGSTGVTEIINMRGADKAADYIGYSIKDLSGDNIPELIIGFIDEGNKGSEILALYTCKNEKTVFVFESMTKSAYFLMNDGNIFHQGSGGAIYCIFASYSLSEDATELICNDFWFTDKKYADTYEIGYYHNTIGEYNKNVSEELNVSEDEFFAKQAALIAEKATTELTPFADIL